MSLFFSFLGGEVQLWNREHVPFGEKNVPSGECLDTQVGNCPVKDTTPEFTLPAAIRWTLLQQSESEPHTEDGLLSLQSPSGEHQVPTRTCWRKPNNQTTHLVTGEGRTPFQQEETFHTARQGQPSISDRWGKLLSTRSQGNNKQFHF